MSSQFRRNARNLSMRRTTIYEPRTTIYEPQVCFTSDSLSRFVPCLQNFQVNPNLTIQQVHLGAQAPWFVDPPCLPRTGKPEVFPSLGPCSFLYYCSVLSLYLLGLYRLYCPMGCSLMRPSNSILGLNGILLPPLTPFTMFVSKFTATMC